MDCAAEVRDYSQIIDWKTGVDFGNITPAKRLETLTGLAGNNDRREQTGEKKCAERHDWRLGQVAQRTIFWFNATIGNKPLLISKKTFRNPIIQAKEMALQMEQHNLSMAELARKLGISRARVTQMLNLLKLPEELIEEVERMEDYWRRRLVTERSLRKILI